MRVSDNTSVKFRGIVNDHEAIYGEYGLWNVIDRCSKMNWTKVHFKIVPASVNGKPMLRRRSVDVTVWNYNDVPVVNLYGDGKLWDDVYSALEKLLLIDKKPMVFHGWDEMTECHFVEY